MRDGGAPGHVCRWLVDRLDTSLRAEVFEPAWEDLRAAVVRGDRSRALLAPLSLLLAVQCLVLQRRSRRSGSERGRPGMAEFARDLRYGARSLMRRRSFAALSVLTLALGIGATTAVFALANGLLLRPLPFGVPDRLVAIDGIDREGNDMPVSFGF